MTRIYGSWLHLALNLWSLVAVSQITVTLQASKDAAIGFHDGAFTAGNNYGGAIQNAAFCIPGVAAPSGYNVNRALIDFNLGVIPANATVVSAALNLYATGPFGSVPGHIGPANSCYIERITQPWGEYTATWNNQPTSTTLNQVTLSATSNATQDYTNINVFSLVQDMLNNSPAGHGFLLKLVNQASSNGLSFCSRDHSNTGSHPTLVITYRQGETNVADQEAGKGFEICPSLHEGTFTVTSSHSFFEAGDRVEIVNMEGQVLKSLDILAPCHELTVQLPGLESGIYICRYFSGSKIVVKKIAITEQ